MGTGREGREKKLWIVAVKIHCGLSVYLTTTRDPPFVPLISPEARKARLVAIAKDPEKPLSTGVKSWKFIVEAGVCLISDAE